MAKLTERQKQNDMLRKNILLIKGGKTNEYMAQRMNIGVNTFAKRIKEPDTMTVSEVMLLCSIGRVAVADFMSKELKIG